MNVPIGNDYPTICNAVIEIPAGSKVKYEYDPDTTCMFVDRILYSSVVYPHNYGYIPETLGEDGDPLDVLVIMQEPVFPGCYLKAKIIELCSIINSTRSELNRVSQELNQIGEC